MLFALHIIIGSQHKCNWTLQYWDWWTGGQLLSTRVAGRQVLSWYDPSCESCIIYSLSGHTGSTEHRQKQFYKTTHLPIGGDLQRRAWGAVRRVHGQSHVFGLSVWFHAAHIHAYTGYFGNHASMVDISDNELVRFQTNISLLGWLKAVLATTTLCRPS